jgi:hypothetical protein
MLIDFLRNRRHGYGRIVLLSGAVAALTAATGAGKVWVTDIVVNLPTQDSSSRSFRNIGVGVQNDTDAAATFDITCEWKCPYGNVKNWSASVEQGAYLDAKKSRGFERDANMGCDPIPPELTFSCEVAKRGPKDSKGKTTWTVLNTGKKTVKIPQF